MSCALVTRSRTRCENMPMPIGAAEQRASEALLHQQPGQHAPRRPSRPNEKTACTRDECRQCCAPMLRLSCDRCRESRDRPRRARSPGPTGASASGKRKRNGVIRSAVAAGQSKHVTTTRGPSTGGLETYCARPCFSGAVTFVTCATTNRGLIRTGSRISTRPGDVRNEAFRPKFCEDTCDHFADPTDAVREILPNYGGSQLRIASGVTSRGRGGGVRRAGGPTQCISGKLFQHVV